MTLNRKASEPYGEQRGSVSRKSSFRNEQGGQALAETALVLVVVILLIGGLIEFGWAYFRFLALQDAAGEGAAYGTMFPEWHDNGDNPDPNNIAYRVRHESQSNILDWSAITVTVEAPFMTPGNPITVTASYDHNLLTPLITEWIPGGSITLRATAVQTILAPSP